MIQVGSRLRVEKTVHVFQNLITISAVKEA